VVDHSVGGLFTHSGIVWGGSLCVFVDSVAGGEGHSAHVLHLPVVVTVCWVDSAISVVAVERTVGATGLGCLLWLFLF